MTTIGYIRQSKRADLDVALSYDAQLGAIHRLAERDGIDPASVVIFADMGRSGAAGKEKLRPAYLEALALMEADGVGAIYTLSLTRLARSAGELERVAGICETRGIRLVTDKEGAHDPRNPMQSALFGMIGVFAKFERELAVQRARDNVAVRRARGERMGRAPYGERPGEDPEVIAAAFRWLGSLNAVAATLNDAGVLSALGRGWSGTSVRHVIQRHDPALLPAQRASRGVKPSSPFLLFRLLRCACGRTMTASRDGRGNRQPVYRCHAADTLVDHPRPTRVRESEVMPWIMAEAGRFDPRREGSVGERMTVRRGATSTSGGSSASRLRSARWTNGASW